MDEKTLVQEETQLFLFDFTARELGTEFQAMVHSVLNEAFKGVKEVMDELSPGTNTSNEPIKDFYHQDCKPALEQFKETAKEIFHVPDNVELPIPKKYLSCVKEDVTDEDIEKVEREVEELEDQLMQARVYQATLKQRTNFVTNCIEPRLKLTDACFEARERVRNMGIEERINKFVRDIEEDDTVEKVYNGSSQAENPDFFKDKIGK